MSYSWILICGTALAFLAVSAGAFAAHSLQSSLGTYGVEIFGIAAQYQMYHALGLVLIAVILQMKLLRAGFLIAAAILFILGILLFSGSLYLLALTGLKWLGAVTPLGGLAFLVGWAMLTLAAIKERSS